MAVLDVCGFWPLLEWSVGRYLGAAGVWLKSEVEQRGCAVRWSSRWHTDTADCSTSHPESSCCWSLRTFVRENQSGEGRRTFQPPSNELLFPFCLGLLLPPSASLSQPWSPSPASNCLLVDLNAKPMLPLPPLGMFGLVYWYFLHR